MSSYQNLTPFERELLDAFFAYDDGENVLKHYLCSNSNVDGEVLTGLYNLFIDRLAGTIEIADDLHLSIEPQTYNIEFLRSIVCVCQT